MADPIDTDVGTAFAEAQSNARRWADRSMDLSQSGDTEGASHAARLAAGWVARMRDIEAGMVDETRSPRAAKLSSRKVTREHPGLDGSAASENNVTLRAWSRAYLPPSLRQSG
jgi:hypothetical protein